jgi:hypothetical protein
MQMLRFRQLETARADTPDDPSALLVTPCVPLSLYVRFFPGFHVVFLSAMPIRIVASAILPAWPARIRVTHLLQTDGDMTCC